jgi:hypothetical protein
MQIDCEKLAIGVAEMLDAAHAAAALGVKLDTLAAWRRRGSGPPFITVARRTWYRPQDIRAFLDARVRASTREPLPPAGATPPAPR